MELLLKDDLLMTIESNGQCTVKDFDRLPFALRKPEVALIDFIEWASNRTLSIGRSYAKEILNSLRLSQVNRYAVCKACRAVSLEDAYWIRQTDDQAEWEEVNLFKNKLSLFITEVSLSGSNTHYRVEKYSKDTIHTPELTTLGANAKGWIRSEDGLYLHKVGKNELPASEILEALQIKHIPYYESEADEVRMYLSEERRGWIEGVGEKIVKSRLFTTEDQALVTFEEFGMGLLLNFIWDSKLSIYFILGFALSSFLGVSNIFVAIVGVFLAYLEMNRFMERGKTSSEVSANNNNVAEEDFFNE